MAFGSKDPLSLMSNKDLTNEEENELLQDNEEEMDTQENDDQNTIDTQLAAITLMNKHPNQIKQKSDTNLDQRTSSFTTNTQVNKLSSIKKVKDSDRAGEQIQNERLSHQNLSVNTAYNQHQFNDTAHASSDASQGHFSNAHENPGPRIRPYRGGNPIRKDYFREKYNPYRVALSDYANFEISKFMSIRKAVREEISSAKENYKKSHDRD